MSSPRLYRGKPVAGGEMVKGGHIVVENHHFIVTDDARLDYEEDGDTYLVFRGSVEVIPESVGQYTGKPDKVGIEMWGGDIVKLDDYPDKGVFVIEYEPNKAAYWLHNSEREEAIYSLGLLISQFS